MELLDLIFVDSGTERTMSAVLDCNLIGPFPSKGAFGPIAERLAALDPEQFGDIEQTILRLTTLHFRNMHYGRNSSGQDYPFRLSSVSHT